MSSTYVTGGCLCGQVRFQTTQTPVRVMGCHCATCKLRTGAAFGIGIYFDDQEVEFLQGSTQSYTFHSDTTGRWIKNEFCPQCASTISWTLEMRPGLRAIAGGSYDDPRWFTIAHHIWTRSSCNGMLFPEDVSVDLEALS